MPDFKVEIKETVVRVRTVLVTNVEHKEDAEHAAVQGDFDEVLSSDILDSSLHYAHAGFLE